MKSNDDYFSSYGQRMINNEKFINGIVEELNSMGYLAKAGGLGRKSFFNVTNKEKTQGCYVQFSEVPYSWDIHVDIDKKLGKGSSARVLTIPNVDSGDPVEQRKNITPEIIISKFSKLYN